MEEPLPDSSDPRAPTAGRAHSEKFTMFAAIGVANTAMDFLVFASLAALGAPALVANLMGFGCANAQSYALNARFTFATRALAAPMSWRGYSRFVGAHVAGLAISSAFIAAFSGALGAVGAKAAAVPVVLIWNYLASALYAFAPPRAASAKGAR